MSIVRTAVIPVAGLGTRMLPASKSIPKEMLPVVDRPLIQHVVEECIEAGLERVVLVTRRGKAAIEDHFDRNPELEDELAGKGKYDLLSTTGSILPPGFELISVRQPRAAGLGDAIRCAAPVIGTEPFAVLLPDVLMGPKSSAFQDLQGMLRAYQRSGAAQVLVEAVPEELVDRYGIVDCNGCQPAPGGSAAIAGLVEKPQRGTEPSRLAIVGRYVLPNEVLESLATSSEGAGGEIQLTDALRGLGATTGLQAVRARGETHDCGNPLGYAQACLAFALNDPVLARPMARFVRGRLVGVESLVAAA